MQRSSLCFVSVLSGEGPTTRLLAFRAGEILLARTPPVNIVACKEANVASYPPFQKSPREARVSSAPYVVDSPWQRRRGLRQLGVASAFAEGLGLG